MTQKEQFMAYRTQCIAWEKYVELCIVLNEVPKEEIKVMIKDCLDTKTLKNTVTIFEKAIENQKRY